jgi:uncharacterized membrane protein
MHMSDLIAIAYPDRYTAEPVRETLTDLMAQRTFEHDDAVVVTRSWSPATSRAKSSCTRRFDPPPQAPAAGSCGAA